MEVGEGRVKMRRFLILGKGKPVSELKSLKVGSRPRPCLFLFVTTTLRPPNLSSCERRFPTQQGPVPSYSHSFLSP